MVNDSKCLKNCMDYLDFLIYLMELNLLVWSIVGSTIDLIDESKSVSFGSRGVPNIRGP